MPIIVKHGRAEEEAVVDRQDKIAATIEVFKRTLKQWGIENYQYRIGSGDYSWHKSNLSDIASSGCRYDHRFSFTTRIFDRPLIYSIAIVLHEIAHAIAQELYGYGVGHDKRFREIEIELLTSESIFPKQYSRVYWRRLEDSQGHILYQE